MILPGLFYIKVDRVACMSISEQQDRLWMRLWLFSDEKMFKSFSEQLLINHSFLLALPTTPGGALSIKSCFMLTLKTE